MSDFRAYLRSIDLHAPQIPLTSNRTGTMMTDAQATDPDYWVATPARHRAFRRLHRRAGARTTASSLRSGRARRCRRWPASMAMCRATRCCPRCATPKMTSPTTNTCSKCWAASGRWASADRLGADLGRRARATACRCRPMRFSVRPTSSRRAQPQTTAPQYLMRTDDVDALGLEARLATALRARSRWM